MKFDSGPSRLAQLIVVVLVISTFAVVLGVRAFVGGDETEAANAEVPTTVAGSAAPAAVAAGASTVAPAPGHCPTPDERTNEADVLYNGTDPNRLLLPYSPFRLINYPCVFPRAFRAALLYPDAIVLLEGGTIYRSIPFDASRNVPLMRIVEAVEDPTWMADLGDGIVQIDTAFVQLAGTSVTVESPEISEVRLTNRPHVFFGGRRAAVRFEGVTITSWNASRDEPDREPSDGRPFILYELGSRLDIVDSTVVHLGSDRSGAYGTSWRTGGSTGSAINSTFAENWFGVYTFQANDIVFRGNVFRDNTYYGLDPHDDSAGLIVEDNEAYGNGSHGLIFSRGVVDSVMRNNHVHDNGGNGIVLDFQSDRNVIEDNLIENNAKDGIVLLGSGHSRIEGNTINGNGVAIRANQVGSNSIEIRNNDMEGNLAGIRLYGGASDVVVVDNRVYATSAPAVVVDAPRSTLRDLEVVGAPVGVELRTVVDMSNVNVSSVDTGVVVKATAIVEVRGVTVDARSTALRLQPGSVALLGENSWSAPTPISGGNEPGSWRDLLPFLGLGAIVLAILLELVRWRREPTAAGALAPPGVLNVA